MVTKIMKPQNAVNNFLSLNLNELFDWIESAHKVYLSGGFDSDTAKAMLEQELLYWIDENNKSIDVENEVFSHLESLS